MNTSKCVQASSFDIRHGKSIVSIEFVSQATAWALRFYGTLTTCCINAQKALLSELAPTSADYDAVFSEDYVAEAKQAYAKLWQFRPIFPSGRPRHARVQLYRASEMRRISILAGSQRLSPCLQESRMWGRIVSDTAPVLDGLVFLPHRVVWFPRPDLFLTVQLFRRQKQTLKHWCE